MFILGLLVTTASMFCFATSQSKQAKLLFKAAPEEGQQRVAYWCGWFFLLAAALQGVDAYGFGVGLVSLCAWLSVGAWAVAIVITWRRP